MVILIITHGTSRHYLASHENKAADTSLNLRSEQRKMTSVGKYRGKAQLLSTNREIVIHKLVN